MSKENQAILRVLSKYNNVAKKLEVIKYVEESSIDDYLILWNCLCGKYDNNSRMNYLVDQVIDDSFSNSARAKPNIDSKNPLDHSLYDFKKIFSDYDRFTERLDGSVRHFLPIIEAAKNKIVKSGGIFGNPLSASEVEEFIDLIQRLDMIKDDIFRYLAIGCLMKRTFDSLTYDEKIKTLKLGGIYVKRLPNVPQAYDYDKLYKASLLFIG